MRVCILADIAPPGDENHCGNKTNANNVGIIIIIITPSLSRTWVNFSFKNSYYALGIN